MRIIERKWIEADKDYAEMAGTSSESKPTTGIVGGSLYMETDTGDVYVFNETSATWTKIGG